MAVQRFCKDEYLAACDVQGLDESATIVSQILVSFAMDIGLTKYARSRVIQARKLTM